MSGGVTKMYSITKWFGFESSHVLYGLPEGHKCGRLPSHGHSYRVAVTLKSQNLLSNGFVVDYADFDFFKKYIDDEIDHRFLNEVLPIQPSAENLAKYFFDWIYLELQELNLNPEFLYSVTVKETLKTEAVYSKS
jgi:6-pyruvoyltetrahydropterin/6-carboxytetrahydropterin synthase